MDKDNSLDTRKQETALAEGERTRASRAYRPRTDIYETGEEILLTADIPGADESRVDITLEKNILTINARVDAGWFENRQLAYQEYGLGDFQRSFALSGEIDREKIEAVVRNGVLTLHLPKSPAARSRKIAVKAG
jgi:HSP20 family molecular chaperone IbpA